MVVRGCSFHSRPRLMRAFGVRFRVRCPESVSRIMQDKTRKLLTSRRSGPASVPFLTLSLKLFLSNLKSYVRTSNYFCIHALPLILFVELARAESWVEIHANLRNTFANRRLIPVAVSIQRTEQTKTRRTSNIGRTRWKLSMSNQSLAVSNSTNGPGNSWRPGLLSQRLLK